MQDDPHGPVRRAQAAALPGLGRPLGFGPVAADVREVGGGPCCRSWRHRPDNWEMPRQQSAPPGPTSQSWVHPESPRPVPAPSLGTPVTWNRAGPGHQRLRKVPVVPRCDQDATGPGLHHGALFAITHDPACHHGHLGGHNAQSGLVTPSMTAPRKNADLAQARRGAAYCIAAYTSKLRLAPPGALS